MFEAISIYTCYNNILKPCIAYSISTISLSFKVFRVYISAMTTAGTLHRDPFALPNTEKILF